MAKKQKEKKEKEERCEECDSEADERELVDVVLNGALATLCRRCARINQAIIIEKPTSEQLATAERLSITRMTERIARIPGLAEELRKIPSIAPNEVTVGDLRELQEKKREEDKETEKKKEI